MGCLYNRPKKMSSNANICIVNFGDSVIHENTSNPVSIVL